MLHGDLSYADDYQVRSWVPACDACCCHWEMPHALAADSNTVAVEDIQHMLKPTMT